MAQLILIRCGRHSADSKRFGCAFVKSKPPLTHWQSNAASDLSGEKRADTEQRKGSFTDALAPSRFRTNHAELCRCLSVSYKAPEVTVFTVPSNAITDDLECVCRGVNEVVASVIDAKRVGRVSVAKYHER